MTRRIASLFMALALCLSLLPASALAANNTGKMITVENENLVYNGETVTHEFSDGRGTVTWDGTTLTLDGINLSSFDAGIADMIHYEGGDLTVRLQGDNYIIN